MAVRLSAIRAGRPLPPGRFLVLISLRGWVDLRVIVRRKGIDQLKNPLTSGIETATFRLVAQCHNQLRYRVENMENLIKDSRFLGGRFYSETSLNPKRDIVVISLQLLHSYRPVLAWCAGPSDVEPRGCFIFKY
jgi:hypothetical protein